MSLEINLPRLDQLARDSGGGDIPFYDDQIKFSVVQVITDEFQLEFGQLPLEQQATILDKQIIPVILDGVRSSALREFGERYQTAKAADCLEGFLTFLKIDDVADRLFVSLYQSVDPEGYASHIQDTQDGIDKLHTFFREYERGRVTVESYNYVYGYLAVPQRRLDVWRSWKLEGQEQEYLDRRIEAYDLAMPVMERALAILKDIGNATAS